MIGNKVFTGREVSSYSIFIQWCIIQSLKIKPDGMENYAQLYVKWEEKDTK